MSQLGQITHEAWTDAQSVLKWPALARAYAFAIAAFLLLGFFGWLLAAEFNLPSDRVTGLLLGIALLLVDSSVRQFLRRLDIAGAISADEGHDRAGSIRALKRKIVEQAARASDWDGRGGTAPKPDAIADALTFLDEMASDIVIPDGVYSPGDGEVMFQWVRPGTFIEVGFYGDDTISWYARLPGQQVAYGDEPFDRKLGRRLPRHLADALRAVR